MAHRCDAEAQTDNNVSVLTSVELQELVVARVAGVQEQFESLSQRMREKVDGMREQFEGQCRSYEARLELLLSLQADAAQPQAAVESPREPSREPSAAAIGQRSVAPSPPYAAVPPPQADRRTARLCAPRKHKGK